MRCERTKRHGTSSSVASSSKPGLAPVTFLKYLIKKGLQDWSNVCVTTDDRNAETTLRRGAMDHNIRTAIEASSATPYRVHLGKLQHRPAFSY